jgi:hypothetical protein
MIRRLLMDPMTRKELGTLSRRWQTYVLRVVYVAAIGLVLYLSTASELVRRDALSPSEYAALGRRIFSTFVSLEIASLSLLSIAVGADMLTKEVRGGTLGLLALTPLEPWGIVFGKWKAAMAQSALLFFCGLPVVAVSVYLGGASPWDLFWSSAIALSMASLNSALAIRFSATCRASYSAVLATVFTHLGVMFLAGLTLLITLGWGYWVLIFLHPLFALIAIASSAQSELTRLALVSSCGASALYTGLILSWAARSASRRVLSDPALPERFYDLENRAALDPTPPGQSARPREVWQDHPLLWKDLTVRPSGKMSYAARAVLGTFLLLGIYLSWPFSHGGEHPGVLYFWWGCFILLALANGAAAFSEERSGRRGEPLLVTPLTGLEIVQSKLLAGFLGPEPRWMGILFLAMLVGWSYWAGPAGVLMMLLTGVLSLLLAYLVGAALSLRVQTLRAALGGGLAVVGTSILGPFLLRSISESLPTPSRTLETLAVCVGATNPFSIVGPSAPRALEWSFGQFVAFLVCYGAACGGLFLWMAKRFDRWTGRS